MARPSLTNIETALWVSRLGSYSAVARRLHATQPAITLRIRELENSLGLQLFERRGRRMEVTVQGRLFINRIEPMLDSLQQLLDTADGAGKMKGVVRIGSGAPPMTWMGGVLTQLQASMPDVTFEIQIGIAQRLISELQAGQLDFVVISGRTDAPSLVNVPLGQTSLRWLMGASRWTRYGTHDVVPDVKALLNCGPIWLVPRASPYHHEQLAVLRRHGVDPGRVNTCDDMKTIVDLVAHHGGIGYLPHILARHYLAESRLVTVSEQLPWSTAEYSLVHARGVQVPLLRHAMDAIVKFSEFDAVEPSV